MHLPPHPPVGLRPSLAILWIPICKILFLDKERRNYVAKSGVPIPLPICMTVAPCTLAWNQAVVRASARWPCKEEKNGEDPLLPDLDGRGASSSPSPSPSASSHASPTGRIWGPPARRRDDSPPASPPARSELRSDIELDGSRALLQLRDDLELEGASALLQLRCRPDPRRRRA